MFSATLTGKTLDIANTLAKDICIIRVKNNNRINENIIHGYVIAEKRKKVETLRKLLYAANPKRALVFINDSYDADNALEKLRYNNIKVDSISGNNIMEDRKRALENFRKGSIQVLIASDIAARGLDIKGITHVINLDVPEDPNDYLHRCGRVGRAGETGEVFSIIEPKEEELIKIHEKNFKISIPQKHLYKGKVE